MRAKDAAGNVDGTPASQTFVIDTTAPDTTLTLIASPTNDNTPTFTFSGGGTSFECRVDGGTFAACTSPFTTGTLSDGTHTFDVRAKNAAGTVDPTPGTQTFIVDTAAPGAPAFTAPADNALFGIGSVTFTGTAEAGATVQLREGATLRGSGTATSGTWSITVTQHQRRLAHLHSDGHRRRRQHERRHQPHRSDRHDGARHDDRQRPDRPDQRQHADLHVHVQRGRRDVRVQP